MLTDKQSIQTSIQEAFESVARKVEGLSEEQAFHHVIIDKWSVAEQLIHLNVAAQALGTALGMPKIALRAFAPLAMAPEAMTSWSLFIRRN
jgi:hypothetical protein